MAPDSDPELPELWHFAISHFTEKARWALDYKGVAHRRRMLFLDYPVRIPLATGQMSLPVLFVEGKPVCGSGAIIDRLEALHPDPPLYPSAPAERARALALQAWFDEELGPHIRAVVVQTLFDLGAEATSQVFGMGGSEAQRRSLRSVFPLFKPLYAARHRMLGGRVELGRRKLHEAVARLEAEIGPSGYLVGDRFSVADLCAASLAYPLAQPKEYPYQAPEPYGEAIADILDAGVGERAREWVARMYSQHRGVSAAVEEP